MKIITQGDDTRSKLASGIYKLNEVTKHTLGPRAKHVVLGFEFANPKVLDDGAMIAREVELEDPTENVGAQLARMVSEKTNKTAGDGTTTSLVLANALTQALLSGEEFTSSAFKKRMKLIESQGAIDEIVSNLKKLTVKIETNEQIRDVATISSGSSEIGRIIADIYRELGNDAVIIQQDQKKAGINYTVSNGMRFESGIPPHFATDTEKVRAEATKCPILIYDGVIENTKQIAKYVPDGASSLTVIADDFSESVLDSMLSATLRGFRFIPIKAPYYGPRRLEFMEDLAMLVTGKVASESVEGIVSVCERVESNMFETTITGLSEDNDKVQKRLQELKEKLEASTSDYDAAQIKERVAKLSSGIATIKVGMPTEAEQKTVMAKLEDAINASRTAIEGGIVPGGGLALYRASEGLLEANKAIVDAVRKPFHQILENCGWDAKHVEEQLKTENAFDSERGVFGDAITIGLIDPAQVTLGALQNAWSIAQLVYRSEAGVVWKENKKDPHTS